MIVTIDGPAGTGKSSVAQRVAQTLGFDFLDTGAMYRAVALTVLHEGIDLSDPQGVGNLAQKIHLELDFTRIPPAVLVNARNVSGEIRSPEVSSAASVVAAVPAVRQVLVDQQRRIGRQRKNLVTEGRDQGSVVFPDAQLKIYLDATVQERARRRGEQLRQSGRTVDTIELEREISQRDARDAGRDVGPLKKPDGAVVVDSTHLSEAQVVDRIVAEARRKTVAERPGA